MTLPRHIPDVRGITNGVSPPAPFTTKNVKFAPKKTRDVTEREYPPGTQAPVGGTYEQRNVLGSPTGTRVTLDQGEMLPAAPRGFTWRMVEASGTGDPDV